MPVPKARKASRKLILENELNKYNTWERTIRSARSVESRFADFEQRIRVGNPKGSMAFAHAQILSTIRETIGSLKGKRVLEIGGNRNFSEYLEKTEHAEVVDFQGYAEELPKEMQKFNLVIANRVFEKEGFHPAQKRISAQQAMNSEFYRRLLLRNIASKLEKGGFFIYTASSSPQIFKPQDAKSTGFKIIRFNEPYYALHSEALKNWKFTVLQRI